MYIQLLDTASVKLSYIHFLGGAKLHCLVIIRSYKNKSTILLTNMVMQDLMFMYEV